MLKALADEHVVAPLVEALRRRGMDVVTVQDLGQHEAGDAQLLAEALRDERVMLTNDRDFLVIAADLANRQQPFAPIFFWPQQARKIGYLVRSIIREAKRSDYAAACSRVYFY